ncbi:MAG: glycosyltransferase family 39 protein, partial [Deltaproteobacteria bacterium]|nr:glycosyltransferase family 39 protein [Deltaproteobacteria bacterium]
QLARQIVAGTAPFEPYWQAPLYPLVLAGFQWGFGDSLYAVQWFHIVVGSLNCVLLFHLSETLFGLRTAVVTGAIAVLYAPFWLFDVQPLPANLTVLLYLLMALSYLRFRTNGEVAWLGAAGVLLGAAIVTHGLAIFTLPVFVYDLASCRREQDGPARRLGRCIALFLAVTLLAPAAVSVRNSLAAGTPIFVSYNAGINLFVGNNRDLEQTLARRGGFEWTELFRDPYTSGAKEPAAMNRFFIDRVVEEWLEAPGALLIGSFQKVLLAISGSEPKRNFPIYPLRESSWALSASLFEISAFGRVLFAYPAGLIIPLAIFGFLVVRREGIPQGRSGAQVCLPGWIAICHMLGMVVFFPASRYRVPGLILLIPYAAEIAVRVFDRMRSGAAHGDRVWSPTWTGAVAAALLFVVVNPVASNMFRHPIKERAEHLYFDTLWEKDKLRFSQSVSGQQRMLALANETMRIDPGYAEPVHFLALYYLDHDIARSVALFEKLNELVPNDTSVLRQLQAATIMRDKQESGP